MGVGRATWRALAGFGYVLLGLLAAAGVVLSCAYLTISTDLGRGLVVPRALRAADDALAGSIQLERFHLLGQGGLELVGTEALLGQDSTGTPLRPDTRPDGHLLLVDGVEYASPNVG